MEIATESTKPKLLLSRIFNKNPRIFSTLLLAISIGVLAGIWYFIQSPGDISAPLPHETEVNDLTPPSNLFGPFSPGDTMVDYLIVPSSTLFQSRVLSKTEDILGTPARFIRKDVTVLSNNGFTPLVKGDLYQFTPPSESEGKDIFDYIDALENVFGEGTHASFTYIASTTNVRPSSGSRSRFINEKGEDFAVYLKRNPAPEIIYTSSPLPESLERCLEGECPRIDFLHADLSKDFFVVGYTRTTETGPEVILYEKIIQVSRKQGADWNVVLEKSFSSSTYYSDLKASLSPQGRKLAISNFQESSIDQFSPHYILDLATFSLQEVTMPARLFPTFWLNETQLLYGSAVGKDCGFYPREAKFDLVSGKVEKDPEEVDVDQLSSLYYYPYGTTYESSKARVGVTHRGSSLHYLEDMCGTGELEHQIARIDSEGRSQTVFTAPENTYIEAGEFLDENNFFFALLPVTEYKTSSHGGRAIKYVTATGPAMWRIIDMSTLSVREVNLSELNRITASAAGPLTLDGFYYIKEIDASTIDLDYTTLILKLNGSPIDRVDYSSHRDGRSPYPDSYQRLGDMGKEHIFWLIDRLID